MSSAAFHIRPSWPDTVVYEDEHGQVIPFDTRTMAEPPTVLVPAARYWADKTPVWAHDQRDLIVARLRAAGCTVAEQDGDMVRTLSPHGGFRVDEERTYDERSGPWETVQVVTVPGDKVLAYAIHYGTTDAPRFPRAGVVQMTLQHRSGQRHELAIDTVARTFRPLPGEEDEPLSRLQARLDPGAPPEPAIPPAVTSAMNLVLQMLMMLGCGLFVLTGAWVALTTRSTKDRWMGVLCIVFFGACFAASWSEFRQARRNRLPKARRQNPDP